MMIRTARTTLLLAIVLACAASAPRVARASGGECYSDSDCGGGRCSSGKCTTAGGKCYSDSECPGGRCSSGECTTAGGKCYSDSECGGGRCSSGKCTTAGGKCSSGRCTNAR